MDDYDIIINSGASESNNFILKATINGYTRKIKRVPHIIVTSIEHKSLLECARRENDEGFHFTFIEPETSGSININHIKAAILPHTALVCCMHANNETGALNAVEELGQFLANRIPPIPFYVDYTQSFGKLPPNAQVNKILAFSTSFHKFGGPAGIGILAISKNFLKGYDIKAEICGAQNHGMRGGTENLSLIAGAFGALHQTAIKRDENNLRLMRYCKYIVATLTDKIRAVSYYENWDDENRRLITGIPNYKNTKQPPKVEMVVLGCSDFNFETRAHKTLPNTVMLAFLNHESPDKFICNFKLVDYLRSAGFIIGMGSACNTGKLSYVLEAMQVPPAIIKSSIRISFGDYNRR